GEAGDGAGDLGCGRRELRFAPGVAYHPSGLPQRGLALLDSGVRTLVRPALSRPVGVGFPRSVRVGIQRQMDGGISRIETAADRISDCGAGDELDWSR